jgi:O-acetylserine/cysteine efflux transporter
MLVAYTLWAWAIARRGIGRTVPYLFLIPIATAVLAALILGEQFGAVKIGGAGLVLVGTALVRLLGGRSPTGDRVPPLKPSPARPVPDASG